MQNTDKAKKRAFSPQPEYWDNDYKLAARAENVRIYRELTGNSSIPKGKGYWTLCNKQPDNEGSEIVQLCNLGLITKNQFFGVDWNMNADGTSAGIIEENKIIHPDAHWFAGDWVETIREQDCFNPALVYLDTTSFADHLPAAKMVSSTMHLCEKDTVILANVMLTDPRSHRVFSPDALMRHLEKLVVPLELRKWQPVVRNFTYSGTGKTEMITYVLHKIGE